MKKTILSLCVSAFLFSCEKESTSKEFCWECTVTQTTTATGFPSQTSSAKVQQCGLTEEQAKQTEQQGTTTATSSQGGITATVSQTTTCAKK